MNEGGAQTYTEQHSEPCYFTAVEIIDPNDSTKVTAEKHFYVGQNLDKSTALEVKFDYAYTVQPVILPGTSQFAYDADGVTHVQSLTLAVSDYIQDESKEYFVGVHLVPHLDNLAPSTLPTDQAISGDIRHFHIFLTTINFVVTGQGVGSRNIDFAALTLALPDANIYSPDEIVPNTVMDITITVGMKNDVPYARAEWGAVFGAKKYSADMSIEMSPGIQPTEDAWNKAPAEQILDITNATFTPVLNGKTYWFRVCSIGSSGKRSAWTVVSKLVTLNEGVQGPPTGLVARPDKYLSIMLTWNEPLNNTYRVNGYNIYRTSTPETVGGNTSPWEYVATSSVCFFDDLPLAGMAINAGDDAFQNAFYYCVTAINIASQESIPSNVASATPRGLDDYTIEANSLYDALKGIDATKLFARDIITYSGTFVNKFRSCTARFKIDRADPPIQDYSVTLNTGTLTVAAFTNATMDAATKLSDVDLTSSASLGELTYTIASHTWRMEILAAGTYWVYVEYPINLYREPTSGGTTLTPILSSAYPSYVRQDSYVSLVLGIVKSEMVVNNGVSCLRLTLEAANAQGTTISGDQISTGSITADSIAVGTITADQLDIDSIGPNWNAGSGSTANITLKMAGTQFGQIIFSGAGTTGFFGTLNDASLKILATGGNGVLGLGGTGGINLYTSSGAIRCYSPLNLRIDHGLHWVGYDLDGNQIAGQDSYLSSDGVNILFHKFDGTSIPLGKGGLRYDFIVTGPLFIADAVTPSFLLPVTTTVKRLWATVGRMPEGTTKANSEIRIEVVYDGVVLATLFIDQDSTGYKSLEIGGAALGQLAKDKYLDLNITHVGDVVPGSDLKVYIEL